MIKVFKQMLTFDELLDEVERDQGIRTVLMEDLRRFVGAKRIGRNVNSEITRELDARGLSHQPKKLPNRKEFKVRIVKRGTAAASLVDAVRQVNHHNDRIIRKAAQTIATST